MLKVSMMKSGVSVSDSMQTISRRHQTPLGEMHSAWTAAGLRRFALEPSSASQDSAAAIPVRIGNWIDRFCHSLDRYFQSGKEDFSEYQIDLSDFSPFMTRVYSECRKIEPGTTQTYKQLATSSNSPKAFRAVGMSMARNRILLVIPCHRVIAAGGDLRGFSAPGGLSTKSILLDLEKYGSILQRSPQPRLF